MQRRLKKLSGLTFAEKRKLVELRKRKKLQDILMHEKIALVNIAMELKQNLISSFS